MWIPSITLLTALLLNSMVNSSDGKDIEVDCMDSQATGITDGGIIANCANMGLTRTSSMNLWLESVANVLQSINASSNHIKTVSTLPVLPRVLTLEFQHNSIKRIDSGAFANLSNLQTLDLSDNMITGDNLKGVLVGQKTSDGFAPLPLSVLNLGQNSISDLHPEIFSHLRYLQDLHLDYNPLVVNEQFSISLRELPELKLLNLAGTNLEYLPKDTFSGTRISTLLLNNNKFTTVPDLSVLGNSLSVLNINKNPIKEFDNSSFLGANKLSEITASGMPELTSIKSGTFSNLRSIKRISCTYNKKLAEIEEKAFWDYKGGRLPSPPSLKEVYLNNNALKQLRQYVLPWTKMTKVTLDGNKWECDCRIHWLATYLRNKNTSIDRITEVKCWAPTWLNGTQVLFWTIDTKSRDENYPCLEEREAMRKEADERLNATRTNTKLPTTTTTELPNTTQPPLTSLQTTITTQLPPTQEEVVDRPMKLYTFLVIAGLVLLVIVVASLIAFNRYRQYRPVYNIDKMASPLQTEMTYIKSNEAEQAERTQLVT